MIAMAQDKVISPACIICGTTFRRAGGKRTCSDACRSSYKIQNKGRRLPPRKYKLCVDKSDKAYILDRIKVNEQTGCWEWQKSIRQETGYGQVGGYPHTAHRLSYMLWKGDVSDLLVRHQCHNKVCCNPDHLLLGTELDNYHDSIEVHREATIKRRGIPAQNRIAVVVNGVSYASKVEAMKELGVGHRTLAKMITSEHRSEAA